MFTSGPQKEHRTRTICFPKKEAKGVVYERVRLPQSGALLDDQALGSDVVRDCRSETEDEPRFVLAPGTPALRRFSLACGD